MKNQLGISYENIGISSYLTVTFPLGTEVVEYQLGMITGNEISYLLAASKRVIDGETVVYYNISSRMALSQVLERRKLTRDEFIRLMEAAVRVGREVKEYQLTEECLVMEPDYIYVDPADCEPSFLYLPIMPDKEGGLKKFLLELVMQGRIEMGGDNFIQAILEVVNARPFLPDKLEECLEHFKGGRKMSYGNMGNTTAGGYGAVTSQGVPAGSQGSSLAGNLGGQPIGSQATGSLGGQAIGSRSAGGQNGGPGGYQPEMLGGYGNETSEGLGSSAGDREQPVGRPPVPAPPSGPKGGGKKKEKPQKPQKTKKEKTATSEDQGEFVPEQAKKKFLIPQAVVMVGLAALASFGAFKNEAGGIAVNNVLAVVLCVAVAEIILYREIYVNGKNGNKKGKSEGGGAKTDKGRKKAGPPLPGQINETAPTPVPRQSAAPTPMVQPQAPTVSKTVPTVQKEIPAVPPIMSAVSDRVLQPVPMYGGMAETEIGGETELWDSSADGMEAYLEYYENGLMTRIVLNKPSTLVGRLQGQVDFAVTDPKVGKVHAEFINQDGKIYVKDLNSKNGTYLNGALQRLNSNMMYPLKDSDRIALAKSEFVLHCSDGQG